MLCHSLACLLWMHHVAGGGRPASRVLLVAPPSEAGAPEELSSFFPVPAVSVPDARLVCSDNDPYCPEGAVSLYGDPVMCCPGRATSTRTPATGRGLRSRRGRVATERQ